MYWLLKVELCLVKYIDRNTQEQLISLNSDIHNHLTKSPLPHVNVKGEGTHLILVCPYPASCKLLSIPHKSNQPGSDPDSHGHSISPFLLRC